MTTKLNYELVACIGSADMVFVRKHSDPYQTWMWKDVEEIEEEKMHCRMKYGLS